MRSIDELLGLPMVSMEEGQQLGTLKGVEIDTKQGRLAYLHLNGSGRKGVVPWESVRSVGAELILIDSRRSILESVPPAAGNILSPYVGDRNVVTESGERLGQIRSYDVDETTGEIRLYHMGASGVLNRLTGKEIVFPHHAIRTFGKDAIIVSDWVTSERKKAA